MIKETVLIYQRRSSTLLPDPMVTRIEIAVRPEFADPRGEEVAHRIRSFLGLSVERVRSCDVYHVDADLTDDDARRVLHEFVDPVLQCGALGRLEHESFDVAVSVGYKPGVTDPVGKSARVAIEDTLGRVLGAAATVFSSRLYLIRGADRTQGERIAVELLANPVIQSFKVETHDEWCGSTPDLDVPRVQDRSVPAVRSIDLDVGDDELARISREGLLALSVEEMRAIRDHFKMQADDPRRRELGLSGRPTDAELECLAQTWSEHCKHKIFNATIEYAQPGRPAETVRSLFDSYIKRTTRETEQETQRREGRTWLVSVFHDNAGVVAFDDRRHLVYKVETHNSPSALDPYGGAITGIVGVNRDPFGTGLGSDLLVNVWGYCFASPTHAGAVPAGLLHPRRIRDGVHQGVIDGGNQSGIPYGRGWELFDERYLGKPLVFCGTVGSLPVEVTGRPGERKGARPGDLIVMTGGRIGADGIHGATFSSAALDESAPVQAVQIGDPITQKLMFDFLLEARDRGLYEAITDNGAGGLSSSVGEMARVPGGARLDLALAPLKYEGLAPWEILVSEAQERMTLAVAPAKREALLDLARRRGVEATVLGEFTDSGSFHVTYGEHAVAYVDMEFLHEGLPEMRLTARWSPPEHEEPVSAPPEDLGEVLLAMLGRLNLCSGEVKARHYDHEVKGLTVVRPYVGAANDVPAEATVFLAAHDSTRGFVLSEGVNPFFSDIDTHAMAAAVVDEAVRRQLCAGARLDRIALLDNFCWPDPVESESAPDGAYKLAQLVRACRGLYETTRAYGTPLISGKDSMKNDAVMEGVKISVPPTLLVSAIGQIDDVRAAITLEPQAAGDVVFLLGATRDETGASEYFRWLGERDGREASFGEPRPYVGNKVPRLDVEATRPLYRRLAAATTNGWVRSAAAPAKGGWALAFARTAIAGATGLDLDVGGCDDLMGLAPDVALFSESPGRLLITVAPGDADRLERHFAGLACRRVGRVIEEPRLHVRAGGRDWLDVDVADLASAFKETLADE
jgi:phosphoribosylformylglycinamidine synthase